MHCTAAIIDRFWVLTAGHCIKGFEEIEVGFGDLEISQSRVPVYKEHLHPRYHVGKLEIYNDIGLLQLQYPLVWNTTVQPICLSRSVQVEENEIVAAAGWGYTFGYLRGPLEPGVYRPDNKSPISVEIPSQLQSRPVAVRNPGFCYNMMQVPEDYICVGGLNNGVMAGDSGGALMARRNGSWYHVGNAHFAGIETVFPDMNTRIDVYNPSAYTKTANYCSFIQDTTQGAVRCEP